MKKLLLSASALCALTAATVGLASAADLRMPVYRAAAVVAAPMNWTGFYLGFNLGESKDQSTTSDSWTWYYNFPALSDVNFLPFAGTLNTTLSNQYRHASMGLLGGLQWGYNWQVGSLLIGFEGDWNWSNEKDTVTYSSQPLATSVAGETFFAGTTQGWTNEEKIDWLTTWRARLGWAHDCYLWYVTGGVAWAKVETNHSLFATPGSNLSLVTGFGAIVGPPSGGAFVNNSTTKTGWVVGGGVETDIGPLFGLGGHNWSMKLEYLYVDLGSVSDTIGTQLVPICQTPTCTAPGPITGSTSFYSTSHIYEQIIRVGINYRFSYAAVAPVVTKY